MNRRQFLHSAAFGGALTAANWNHTVSAAVQTRVSVVKASSRADGVRRAVALLNLPSFGGKDGFIKPNFNSADVTPGSTHNDTLNAVAGELRRLGAGPLTIGDRSGMGDGT